MTTAAAKLKEVPLTYPEFHQIPSSLPSDPPFTVPSPPRRTNDGRPQQQPTSNDKRGKLIF
jgi:hypothetical protein